MKLYKLLVHQRNFSDNDLLINPKEFPGIALGDVVEIFHQDGEFSRLLLQVSSLSEDFQQKDCISVDQSIANVFQLRTYKDVHVNQINPKDVALELLELTFKDQYLTRSDMWRMKQHLVGSCVYLSKKIVYASMRVQAVEMWANGDKVACGVISEDTKIVFRSVTAMIYLFIQMSSEMWEFDTNGDLYIEKAVDGFLTDLVARWKNTGAGHEVTIVLFSRTFYQAASIADFPVDIRDSIQQDHNGRFYEDFYRVVIQGERYDDWAPTLYMLKRLFSEYRRTVLRHLDPVSGEFNKCSMPKGYISTAAQGNFLEMLNMSLNVFENHCKDRNFDRTGQLSVIITAGAGVFEVDRELNNITKQRTIDYGIGSDLVCLGEQPLHAVPLFKFHKKTSSTVLANESDDYNIPHWLNCSFYSREEVQVTDGFIPRLKLPERKLKRRDGVCVDNTMFLKKCSRVPQGDSADSFPALFDYDEYDSGVFKPHKTINYKESKTSSHSFVHTLEPSKKVAPSAEQVGKEHDPAFKRQRYVSEDYSMFETQQSKDSPVPGRASAIEILRRAHAKEILSSSVGATFPVAQPTGFADRRPSCSTLMGSVDDNEEISLQERRIVGSAGSYYEGHGFSLAGYKPQRSLINPFAPLNLSMKVTSNRRRWVHSFPTSKSGQVLSQQHHKLPKTEQDDELTIPARRVLQAGEAVVEARLHHQRHQGSTESDSPQSTLHKTWSLTSINSTSSIQSGRLKSADKSFFESNQMSGSINISTGTGSYQDHSGSISKVARGSLNLPFATTSREGTPMPLATSGSGRTSQHTGRSWEEWSVNTETEWMPGLTTGVDWKSMSVPACLPITTDYCPDKRSLQNDYVVSEYQLLPDTDAYTPFVEDKHKTELDVSVVLKELVSQRLQQGFQLILPLKAQRPQASGMTPATPTPPYGFASTRLMGMPYDESEEYLMSIGRILHKLSLSPGSSEIIVTQYKPRHPYPNQKLRYRYQFRVPDSEVYGMSWVEFKHEQLESYNWNHLDNYICNQGDNYCILSESMKYWRCRFMLLPCNNSATKQAAESSATCDLYTEKTVEEKLQLMDGFIRFMEILNKIRRPVQARKPKISEIRGTPSPLLVKSSNGQGSTDIDSLIAPNANANNESTTSAPTESKEGPPIDTPEKLSTCSPIASILDALCDPNEGICFLKRQRNLPADCFVSIEAVSWIMESVESVQSDLQANELMQTMVDNGLICHASGNPNHPFVNGFYLYFVVKHFDMSKGGIRCNPEFSFDWVEVAINPSSAYSSSYSGHSSPRLIRKIMSSDRLTEFSSSWQSENSFDNFQLDRQTQMFKTAQISLDAESKSGRREWVNVTYSSNYYMDRPYELIFDWLVATGSILGEQVQGWARKTNACGFHLIPTPIDPFALPWSPSSDPLRGPIFVPLNINCLLEGRSSLFQDFDGLDNSEAMLTMQEDILHRFGFLRYSSPLPQIGTGPDGIGYEYSHVTGAMWVLICTGVQPKLDRHSGRFSDLGAHGQYIRRQRSKHMIRKTSIPVLLEIGFLWSWNFLLNRKWRTNNTGDEAFMDKMLADFRAFCSNQDNRLVQYWNEYSSQLQSLCAALTIPVSTIAKGENGQNSQV